jgi:uncharacterized SAM-dependent methyltransferase
MLSHLNELVGADFDPSKFEHRAFFNEKLSRIEMHLVSLADQTVTVGGTPVAFREGETIHTESSYKYTFDRIEKLAEAAGWKVARTMCDPREWFSLHYFVAA